jgi:hypothetical protein
MVVLYGWWIGGATVSDTCNLGVGCDEYGTCYAAAHNRPEMCPRSTREEVLEAILRRYMACDGADGRFHAGELYDVRNEARALLAMAVQP